MASFGHPYKFQRVSRLGSVTARHSSIGRQLNFAALNRGRHLYSAGRPSCWALAHTLVGDFLRPVFQRAAYSTFQRCILNSHQGHITCESMVDIQSSTAEITRGKKEEKKKKPQDENLVSASATQGSHNNRSLFCLKPFWLSISRNIARNNYDVFAHKSESVGDL